MHFFSDDFLALKGSEENLPLSGETPGVCGRHLGRETGSEAFGKVARWIQTVAYSKHKWGETRFETYVFAAFFFMGGMVKYIYIY